MSPDRIVPFRGVLNFRDLGGYVTADGRTTKWGRLFRSNALHELTDEDLVAFRRLGVVSIVDLRSSGEVARNGRGLLDSEAVRFVNYPVLSDAEAEEPRDQSTLGPAYLSRRYLQYLDVGAASLVAAMEEMSVAENYPIVFNCFLGKDRTGVLAALVLSCLGVDRTTIAEDYAITGPRVHLITERLRQDPRVRRALAQSDPVLLAADEATMTEFLLEVDRRFGGARAWVEGAGLSRDRLARLEELVLE